MSVTNPVKLADPRAWKALRFFNLYRIVLAGLFLALYLGGLSPEFIGQLSTAGFVAVTTLYLLFSLLWSLAARERWPSYHWQVYVQAAVDILAITLWVHFSGGITSGLGTLLVVAVGGASLLLPGRSAVLFAALGSIALLLTEAYGWLNELYRTTAYTQTGILGIVLFATALLASTLARRATESEALAVSRGIDLANLATLNEHIIERMQSGLIVVDDAGQIRLIKWEQEDGTREQLQAAYLADIFQLL
jgi:two-component system sensor histidine kinase PilS (NtrC family)